jgi:hypothetical protein
VRLRAGVVLAAALALAGCPEKSPPVAPPASVAPVASVASAAPTSKTVAGWSDFGPGSTLEVETVTETTEPATHATTLVRRTVLARTAGELTLRIETVVSGVPVVTTETRLALDSPLARAPEVPAEAPRETVTTRAGTFDCRRVKTEREGSTAEVWLAPEVPVPVQSHETREHVTSTSTLVALVRR